MGVKLLWVLIPVLLMKKMPSPMAGFNTRLLDCMSVALDEWAF